MKRKYKWKLETLEGDIDRLEKKIWEHREDEIYEIYVLQDLWGIFEEYNIKIKHKLPVSFLSDDFLVLHNLDSPEGSTAIGTLMEIKDLTVTAIDGTKKFDASKIILIYEFYYQWQNRMTGNWTTDMMGNWTTEKRKVSLTLSKYQELIKATKPIATRGKSLPESTKE